MSLADDFDGFLFDLDGVVYLGSQAVPAAPSTLDALRERGKHVGFVTNNAGRSPEDMAAKIRGFGVECDASDVATSAQAVVGELARDLPSGATVLVVGSPFLAEEVRRRGLVPVTSADDDPAAVVQGWSTTLDQPILFEACLAVGRGVPWYASNLDLTIPTDRGLGPGSGSFIRLVSTVTGREPGTVGGKPYAALYRAGLERLRSERVIFTGDRLDTDITGANALGLANLWVLTGAQGKAELLAARPEQRPHFIAADLGGLLEPARVATVDGATVRCGAAVARVDDGRAVLSLGDDPVDGLWALAQLAWRTSGLDAAEALEQLPLH